MTPTNIHALLEFANGATVTLGASWDVWAHRHGNMELYGTDGSLFVPDPNFFGGTVEAAGRDGKIEPVPEWDHPFGVPNQGQSPGRMLANYRTAGLADMALAILENRDARCSLDRALHALDVMTSILKSGEMGAFVDLQTTCSRPAPLGPDEARALLA
jgi:predicted dehydrogenase